MPTRLECQRTLSKLGVKRGVSPNLIATRLLSDDDKADMMDGNLPDHVLELAIRLWMDAKQPDYAHGDTRPYRPPH